MGFRKEIDILIRAGESAIWIDTYEFERASDIIVDICQDMTDAERLSKFIIFRWDNLNGFTIIYKDNITLSQDIKGQIDAITNVDEHITPDSCFRAIYDLTIKMNNKFALIFILDNFHSFLSEDITAITQLAKITEIFKNYQSTVIINSPTVNVPDELTKSMTVIDLDYPEYKEVKTYIDEMFAKLKERDYPVKLSLEETDTFIKSFSGLTFNEIENTLTKIVTVRKLDKKPIDLECIPFVLEEKKQILKKIPLLESIESDYSFDDVGGYDNLKKWMQIRKKSYSKKAQEFGLPSPRGVMLIGISGTGKSLTAKALCNMLHQPLYKLDFGSMFGKLVGQSEENLRKALKLAEALSPCILWIDEIDKALSDTSGSGDSGTSSRVFAYFLTWLQEKEKPVFVVCTANDMKLLQAKPELLRSGRFDEKFFLDLPNESERKEIIKVHLKRNNLKVPVDGIDTLADLSSKFSGAEIESAIIDSKFKAFFDNEKNPKVKKEHLITAIQETIPLSKSMSEQITNNRTWAKGRFKLATSISEEESKKIEKVEV